MTSESLLEEIKEERRRNLEDVIRHARWEAEMVKKMVLSGSSEEIGGSLRRGKQIESCGKTLE